MFVLIILCDEAILGKEIDAVELVRILNATFDRRRVIVRLVTNMRVVDQVFRQLTFLIQIF